MSGFFHKYSWLIVIVGVVVLFICLPPFKKTYEKGSGIVKPDTTVTEIKKVYGRLDLAPKTVVLDIPKIGSGVPGVVFVPEEKVKIEVRDCVRYLALPRESSYTEVDDVRIWHSGVDSTIDSLIVMQKQSVIRETYVKKPNKNVLSVGIGGEYNQTIRIPVRLEYSRNLCSFMSFYVYGEYDLARKNHEGGLGVRMNIGW